MNATGLSRSSLYATFGGKQELYCAALERHVQDRSRPVLGRLEKDERGLPAVTDFLAGLIEACCTGEFARWVCTISNAHAARRTAIPPAAPHILPRVERTTPSGLKTDLRDFCRLAFSAEAWGCSQREHVTARALLLPVS
ncbi:hypothetical protein ABZ154_33265 [Streptomyces sp. NPDC006261]|uniref:hypothetical protein n=1 Tax=Streptomyces sp. NPDC006261 TaxID=3156739 RepID=UPI0033BDA2B3